jgi:hypothetical protein
MVFPKNSAAYTLVLIGATAFLVGSGCRKGPPEVVSVQNAATQTKTVFSNAKGDVKTAADQVADSIANAEFTSAIGRIESLSIRPDLAPEQREALAAAQMAVMQKLRESAESGDKQAAEFLEVHRARK